MVDNKFIKILELIYRKLDGQDINWVLTGSLSFVIRGMQTSISDIDIQTDKSGAYEIEKIFQDSIVNKVQFSTANNIRSHFGSLKINGVKVEIMGDIEIKVGNRWLKPVDLDKHKEHINYEKMNIPVLSLKYEYEAYSALGRKEKAEKLYELINDKVGTL